MKFQSLFSERNNLENITFSSAEEAREREVKVKFSRTMKTQNMKPVNLIPSMFTLNIKTNIFRISYTQSNCSEKRGLIRGCVVVDYHYKNTLIQIYRKFHFQKLKLFR